MRQGTVKNKIMVFFLFLGLISMYGGSHAAATTRVSPALKSAQDIIETTAASLLEQLRT